MSNTTFEEVIEKTGTLVYTNVGDSMYPMIRPDGDLIVIEKCNRPLKKYDVPLYKRDTGQYVLHRIMSAKHGKYVMCGDNRRHLEKGIEDRHIIGVLSSVIRNGKEIKMNSKKQRVYAHLWCDFFIIRAALILIKDIFIKIKGR